jgi:hypothetical protein
MKIKDICKLSFGAGNDDGGCGGSGQAAGSEPIEKLAFAFDGEGMSEGDRRRKGEVRRQLIGSAASCVREGECSGLKVRALRWDKCDVCDEHIPKLEKWLDTLEKAGVPVDYEKLNAKGDGKDLFLENDCQGTPCVLVEEASTGEMKKAYDGRQKDVGALSTLLGLPNPFFYGDLDGERPSNLLRGGEREIRNARSSEKELFGWS